MQVLHMLFSLLSLPVHYATIKLQKAFGKQHSNFSVDQLSQALVLIHKNNTIQEGQKLLQGVVSFGNTDTKQVMKPRVDVFALSINTPFKIIIEDTNKGMLYVKDLLPHLYKNTFNWTILLREPFFCARKQEIR